MKKLALLFLSLPLFSFAQITVDTTVSLNFFQVQYISDGEPAMVYSSPLDSSITVYSAEDYSILGSESFDKPPQWGWKHNIYYLSRTLFDCDSTTIEYLVEMAYNRLGGGFDRIVQIRQFGGGKLFERDSVFFNGTNPLIHEYNNNLIYNTSTGTKMILFDDNASYDATIYNLCGNLPKPDKTGEPSGYDEPEVDRVSGGLQSGDLSIFPNPSNDYVNITFELLDNSEEGSLAVFDIQGRLIKSFRVDNRFGQIRMDVQDLPAGEYFYILRDNNGNQLERKSIKF